nr:MAG TPA: hypothetical protein [Caudoviricetes sp.]
MPCSHHKNFGGGSDSFTVLNGWSLNTVKLSTRQGHVVSMPHA